MDVRRSTRRSSSSVIASTALLASSASRVSVRRALGFRAWVRVNFPLQLSSCRTAWLSLFGGSATNRARVGLRLNVSRRTGLSRISSASHFSTIHDTAQKRLQQKPEAAFFGMGSKGERFGVGWQPTGCETQHDLVSRARGKQKYTALPPSGTHRARILEPLILAVIRVALFLGSQRAASFGSAACGRGSGLNRGTGISSSEPCQRSVTRGSVPFG